MIFISQSIDKVTWFFLVCFCRKIWTCYDSIPSMTSIHDRDLILCYEFFQYSNRYYIVEAINLRILYKDMWGPDLPWFPTYIIISSIKGRNRDDFLPFPWWEVQSVFILPVIRQDLNRSWYYHVPCC